MFCPACRGAEMFVLEFERVEIDYCPDCKGVWLDSGELALVGDRSGALSNELLASLERQPGGLPKDAERRRCPVCHRMMLQMTTDTQPPVVLDRCPDGHGLWFDRGELGMVVAAAGAERDNVLARFFAELGAGSENA